MNISACTTHCGYMAVRPARWLFPFGDRITDELPSPSTITIDGDEFAFDLVFAPVRVRRNKSGKRMRLPSNCSIVPSQDFDIEKYHGTFTVPASIVKQSGDGLYVVPDRIVDAASARGVVPGKLMLVLLYDREAVVTWKGLQLAMPCDGIGALYTATKTFKAASQLPNAIGRPGGPLGLGWVQFVIDPVDVVTTFE